ncbi:MAG TPA: RIP metalloprotease, partial [Candidatus Altiarchaeales archaeon]|nr:RIP metalloprotease [Candidatus Altiarchaeales archaeon]
AFVEPDEEKFQRSESIKKMRVLAVGSISNIFTAVLCLIIFIFLIIPSNGLIVEKSTIEEIPPRTRIEMVNNIIISLDAISATMANYVFTENFYNLAELVGNESTVNLTTDKGIFTLDSEKISGLTLVYVPKFRYNVEIMGTNLFLVLAGILFWAYFFNLNVGLVNLLPIAPFDGGKMVMELISMFSPNETILKRITYAILLVGIIIILINALPLVNMALDYISGIDYSSFLPI